MNVDETSEFDREFSETATSLKKPPVKDGFQIVMSKTQQKNLR